MKKLVVLSGAGISAESGLQTFRDSDGLWRNYRFEEVASPVAWERDPELVLDFYNMRRRKLLEVEPNAAHKALVSLEKYFDVQIVTQNVDDLHERAGSTKVLHIHGELRKARSTGDPNLIYDIAGWKLKMGDTCEKGYQLRPHVVWFGEAVTAIDHAINLATQADYFLVVGTSMAVYPAAGIIHYISDEVPGFLIDPNAGDSYGVKNLTIIREKAGVAMPKLARMLVEKLKQEE